ncbi:CocE/NonD family hydrolase [Streptomyces albicerus]|uniref:CocE/NonD family hydrolase n=1 Tax=Streptomyces albicerus TaxID=2569859 RepID=UPI001CECB060|nr:CocE/NonD family hydrolase [Streptomyces albicerus]
MTEIRIEFDVPAEMRDGTVLREDVYRPGGTGPWPVLLSRLPYGKHTPIAAIGLDPLAAARRGFMVVIQDTRGRFASEGEWEPWTYEESDGPFLNAPETDGQDAAGIDGGSPLRSPSVPAMPRTLPIGLRALRPARR